MQKFALFLLFEAAEFMYVNIDRQIVANLRIILYKECNKCDVGLLCTMQWRRQLDK